LKHTDGKDRQMSKLKRSKDRKVTNAVTNGGNVAIANTFGLPAGKQFSCPGATSVCEKICYAGKLETQYQSVKAVLLHNWELVRNADINELIRLLTEMVDDFRVESERRQAPKDFRIHWDGDFFSDDYAMAWKLVIESRPDVRFWVYTRTENAARILRDTENLSLYFSADDANLELALTLQREGIRLAYLADTFQEGQAVLKQATGKPGAKCPENTKQIPLISTNGSACAVCQLCPKGRTDIVFSATKK
jgi:hypothetical protein